MPSEGDLGAWYLFLREPLDFPDQYGPRLDFTLQRHRVGEMFRPEGDFPAGFSGRVGTSTEKGIIRPVYNVNSLLAELDGTMTPVQSSAPFVHAIAATGPDHATLLIANQMPLEYQIDVQYDYHEQTPILENDFGAEWTFSWV